MSDSWPRLRGRGPERATLTALARGRPWWPQSGARRARRGRHREVGAAGVLAGAGADGCQVLRAAGVESELQLAYAGLHQLCRPHLSRLGRLPAPQRQALQIAFGLDTGAPPDRFVVGLAVLTLLCEMAEEQPVICVVDDVQWLDPSSAQALEFVGRRLGAESVGTGLRGPPDRRGSEPRRSCRRSSSAALGATTPRRSWRPPFRDGSIGRVQDRILAECRGNPLALLELPRVASDLAFGTASITRTSTLPLIDRLEHQFTLQLEQLPDPARQLLLVAAADPVGDLPVAVASGELARDRRCMRRRRPRRRA